MYFDSLKAEMRSFVNCEFRLVSSKMIVKSISFENWSHFGLPKFGLLPHLSVWDSRTSKFCFSKSLFSSIPNSTYNIYFNFKI